MLKLPAQLRLGNVPQAWIELEAALRAEMVQVGNGAGQVVSLDASALQDFDSGALSVLLSALRLCGRDGLALKLLDAPPKLRELARVYGLDELLWPEPVVEGGAA